MTNELNDDDHEEIARLIKEGFTSGILGREGRRVTWELKTTISYD